MQLLILNSLISLVFLAFMIPFIFTQLYNKNILKGTRWSALLDFWIAAGVAEQFFSGYAFNLMVNLETFGWFTLCLQILIFFIVWRALYKYLRNLKASSSAR